MTDPYETLEYQIFVESMVKHCHCEPIGNRPCEGVLAGGFCDGMDWRESKEFSEDKE